jgi:hypothetical protein
MIDLPREFRWQVMSVKQDTPLVGLESTARFRYQRRGHVAARSIARRTLHGSADRC